MANTSARPKKKTNKGKSATSSNNETDLNKIKSAGFNAETVGWLLMLAAAITAYSSSPAVFVFYFIGGAYFIYAGKYIRYGFGSNVKNILLANGILSVIYILGIFPIVICVQSFINYSRFKKLPQKLQKTLSESKRYKLKPYDLILAGIFVIVTIAVLYLGVRHRNSESSSKVSNSSQAYLYKAPVNNFEIDFPAKPTVTSSTSTTSGYSIPYAVYEAYEDNSSKSFDVYVYRWPSKGFNYASMSTANLEQSESSSLNSFVETISGKVEATSYTTILGYPATSEQFKLTLGGDSLTGYLLGFFIGNNQYSLLSIGSNSEEFNNFAGSFRYIK
jgi:hypothetical protein